MIHISRYGDCADDALIEAVRANGSVRVNLVPFVPFVNSAKNMDFRAGGGPEAHASVKDMHYIGPCQGDFQIWGHDGPAGHGAIRFRAPVSGWEYREPNPFYGAFTTRDWRRLYVYRTIRSNETCSYETPEHEIGDETAFRNFLRDYEATVFPGHSPRQLVVWCYHDVERGVAQHAWEMIDAPITQRRIYNEFQPVKIVKNHTRHETISYYIRPLFAIR